MIWLVAILVILNIIDAICTLIVHGRYELIGETNPILAVALAEGAASFLGAKLALLCGPLAMVLWAGERSARAATMARLGLLAAIVFYAAVCVWHVDLVFFRRH